MKKIVSILAIFVVIFTGCGDTSEDDLTSITLGMITGTSQIPFIYAYEEGFYEEAGLDVEIVIFNSASDRDAAFKSGDIDVVTADLTATVQYLNSGMEIVATGGSNSYYVLVTSPEVAEIYNDDPSTLDGMTVGLSENTVIEYYVTSIEAMYDVEFEYVPIPSIPDRYAALVASEIDLALMPEPYPTMAMELGSIEVWNSNYEGVPSIGSLTWTSEFNQENPEAIEAFIVATNAAIDEINELGKESYREYAISYNIVDEDDFDVVAQDEYEYIENIEEDVWYDVVDWSVSKGIVEDREYSYEETFINF